MNYYLTLRNIEYQFSRNFVIWDYMCSLLLDSPFLSRINLFINAAQSTNVASYYRDAASRKTSIEKSAKERNHPSSYDSHRSCDLISDRSIYYHRSNVIAWCRNTPPSSKRGNDGTREFSRCASHVWSTRGFSTSTGFVYRGPKSLGNWHISYFS